METMAAIFYVLALLLPLLFFLSKLLQISNPNSPSTVPFSLPIIGHLHLLKQPIPRTLAALSSRYGPVLLLNFGSRRVLVVSSYASAVECFTTNDVAFSDRPCFLAGDYFSYNYSTVESASYGPYWRNIRRVFAQELFAPSRLAALSSARSVAVRSLLRNLVHRSDPHDFRGAEMKSRFSDLSFNVVMEMAAGERYHGEEEGKNLRALIDEVLELNGSLVDFLPWLRWIGWGGLGKKSARLQKEMDKLFQETVDSRRSQRWNEGKKKKKNKFVDALLEMQDKEPDNYTDDIIKGVIQTVMLAGTEPSAWTMEWALALLLNHPQVLDKARSELDSRVGHDRLVSESDHPDLPYIHCVIKETLRLFPPGPLLLPHQSSEDCLVQGYRVPSGTMLLANVYSIQRDPELWADPNEFRPERFDGGEDVEGFRSLPFGYGRRRCPGEGFATRLMGLALASLVQCFEWKRVGQELVDLDGGGGFTMPKVKPLEALCKPRIEMVGVLSQI